MSKVKIVKIEVVEDICGSKVKLEITGTVLSIVKVGLVVVASGLPATSYATIVVVAVPSDPVGTT